jgi:energy-coupling factor transporter ATP-binding protein EcfA2
MEQRELLEHVLRDQAPEREGAARPAGTAEPSVADLRILLSHLSAPYRLDTPLTRMLLRAHGRFPGAATPAAVGDAAATLIQDKIAALKPPADSTWAQRLPHDVLDYCFIRGQKSWQAAQELGISERQLSRERTRALQLLAAELAPRAPQTSSPERIPPTDGHVERDALVRSIAEAVTSHRLVAVMGERGVGKTSVVAALARLVRSELVWWLRIRPGLNDSLESLLFEIGRTLTHEGHRALRDYLLAAMPRPDIATASRLALEGLAFSPRLIVLDDFHTHSNSDVIAPFLSEASERLGELTVVTIGSAIPGSAVIEVPQLSPGETGRLVERRGISGAAIIAGPLHHVCGGHTGTIAAAAAWWARPSEDMKELEQQVASRGPLLNLRGLLEFARTEAA